MNAEAAAKCAEIDALSDQIATFAATVDSALRDLLAHIRQVERTCENGRKPLPDDERYVRRRHVASGMVRIEAQLTADEATIVFQALGNARFRRSSQQESGSRRNANEKETEEPETLADAL